MCLQKQESINIKTDITLSFSCPWILCHWSANKAQKQRSSSSGQKVPAGCQRGSQPWTRDWRKCGWQLHWVKWAWENWRGCELLVSSAGLPLFQSWWWQVEGGCCLLGHQHHCCCCCYYCCHCWPLPRREVARQNLMCCCHSVALGLAGSEEWAIGPAPAVLGHCRLLLFLRPLSATRSPFLGPSSA